VSGSDFLEVSDDASLDLAGFRILLGGRQSDNRVGRHNYERYKPGQ
jgi:hypothetical protein